MSQHGGSARGERMEDGEAGEEGFQSRAVCDLCVEMCPHVLILLA